MTAFLFLAVLAALVAAVYIAVTDIVPLTAVPYQRYSALDTFPLVAVPLFLLAGELMNRGAVTDRLLEPSREVIGRVRGGLAQITVLA